MDEKYEELLYSYFLNVIRGVSAGPLRDIHVDLDINTHT